MFPRVRDPVCVCVKHAQAENAHGRIKLRSHKALLLVKTPMGEGLPPAASGTITQRVRKPSLYAYAFMYKLIICPFMHICIF